MRSTLFHIPPEAFGLPVFGWGLLLAVWAVASVLLMAWLMRRQGFNADTRGYVPVLLIVGAVIVWVLPAISDDFGLPIRGYGVMLLVAVVSGVGMAVYRARRMSVDPELIMSLAVWLFVSGLVGARIFYLVEYWDKLMAGKSFSQQLTALVSINEGGLVVYGMLVVGGGALIAFIYRRKVPGLALADLIAPSVVLGLGLGRIGCFLNGCCFGGPCDLLWAVSFPAESGPHEQQIRLGQVYGLLVVGDKEHHPIIGNFDFLTPAAFAGVMPNDRILRINHEPVNTLAEAQQRLAEAFHAGGMLELTTKRGEHRLPPIPGTQERSRPVHPTQIYSAIDAFLLCALLIAYYPFRRKDGEVTALTLTLHPISRFLLEIIRTDEGPVFGTPFSISQNISLLVLAGGICLWIYLYWQPGGTVWPALRGAGMIGGHYPTIKWRPNPRGAQRTIEEAVRIAKRFGVRIPSDVSFFKDDCGLIEDTLTARGPKITKPTWGIVRWEDHLNKNGKVPFVIGESVFASDEAIVAVFAHEIHELELLRPLLQQGKMTIEQYNAHTSPSNPGNFHDQAWGVSDGLVGKMRGEEKV